MAQEHESSIQRLSSGVLTKNPKQRLAWPDLLHHPFIADLVKGKSSYTCFCVFKHENNTLVFAGKCTKVNLLNKFKI